MHFEQLTNASRANSSSQSPQANSRAKIMELINNLIVCATLVYVLASAALARNTIVASAKSQPSSSSSSIVDEAVASIDAIEAHRTGANSKIVGDAAAQSSALELVEREIAAQIYLAEIMNVTLDALRPLENELKVSDKCVSFNYSVIDSVQKLEKLIKTSTNLAKAQADDSYDDDGGDDSPTGLNSQQVREKRLDLYRSYYKQPGEKKNTSLKKFLEQNSHNLGNFQRRQDLIRANELRKELSARLYRSLATSATLYFECTNDLRRHFSSTSNSATNELDQLELRMNLIPLSVSMDLVSAIATRAENYINGNAGSSSNTIGDGDSSSGLPGGLAKVVIPIAMESSRI